MFAMYQSAYPLCLKISNSFAQYIIASFVLNLYFITNCVIFNIHLNPS